MQGFKGTAKNFYAKISISPYRHLNARCRLLLEVSLPKNQGKVYITSVNQSNLENLIFFEFLGSLFGSGYAGLGIGVSNNVD